MPRSIFAGDKIVPLSGSLWEQGDRAWDRGDLDEAERLFRVAAEMGDAIAMDSLATLLEGSHRTDEAVGWYQRAVEAGSETAAWNLAMHYVPLKNMDRYRHWMRKAAEAGHDDALAETSKFVDPDYMTKLPLTNAD